MAFNNLNPNATMPEQQTTQASMQTGQTDTIPQYISQQQFAPIYQMFKAKGVTDPGQVAQTLIEHGHILQGLNDQNYQTQNGGQSGDNSQNNQPQSLLSKVGSFVGNAAQSIAQPFETAAGSAIRAAQATPQLFSGDFQGAEQTMEKPMFGQKTAPAMNNKELLGTATKAATFLLPATKLGSVAQGIIGGGAFGGGEAAVENKSGNEIVGSAATGAALGGILGKIAPLLTRTSEGSAEDVALNAYKSGLKDVNSYQDTIRQEFANGATKISETNPEAGINFNIGEARNLQEAAKEGGVKLPQALRFDLSSSAGSMAEGIGKSLDEIPIAKLNASETQDLLAALNKKWKVPRIAELSDEIHSKASQAFGPEFDQLYSNYSKQIRGIQSLSDIFDIGNKTPTASDINSSMQQISKLANDKQGSVILKNILGDFKQTSGIDLTNSTKAIAAANKIKSPIAKSAIIHVLKTLGLITAGAVLGNKAKEIISTVIP